MRERGGEREREFGSRQRAAEGEREAERERPRVEEGKRKRGGTRNAGIDSRRRQPAASLKHTTESTRLRDSIYRRDKEGSSREPTEGSRGNERHRGANKRPCRSVDRLGLAIAHRRGPGLGVPAKGSDPTRIYADCRFRRCRGVSQTFTSVSARES